LRGGGGGGGATVRRVIAAPTAQWKQSVALGIGQILNFIYSILFEREREREKTFVMLPRRTFVVVV
jgi:hypothetical protein